MCGPLTMYHFTFEIFIVFIFCPSIFRATSTGRCLPGERKPQPRLGCSVGGSVIQYPKGFRVQFPVRAQAEVVGLIPPGRTGETLIHVARVGVSLSLSVSLKVSELILTG